MYVITGATGNTGRLISETLLAYGKEVGVIGRSLEKLHPLVAQGGKAMVGSLDDVDFLTTAFDGAQAVYVMIPTGFTDTNIRASQNRISEALATALERTGVNYIVHLSSMGADLAEHTGPIAGLHDSEQRLNKLAKANIIHLRATFFMENLLGSIGIIKQMGINGGALRPDVRFPMIAAQNIADIASEYLLNLDFSGHTVRELLGQRDLSMEEVTAVLGKAIGQPDLKYVQFPYDQAEQGMIQAGLSPDLARSYSEMYKAINDGVIFNQHVRTLDNTNPTSIEEFADVFASAYAGQPAD
jgi:uncharacterized protein YbjT (DUF2867 family)